MRNAVEAMASSQRRELSISASRAGEHDRNQRADSGPGLPASVRARLFQPFVTTKPDGMGVGLSVCRAIVDAHGGEMRVEDAPGGGTVFRFTVAARGRYPFRRRRRNDHARGAKARLTDLSQCAAAGASRYSGRATPPVTDAADPIWS